MNERTNGRAAMSGNLRLGLRDGKLHSCGQHVVLLLVVVVAVMDAGDARRLLARSIAQMLPHLLRRFVWGTGSHGVEWTPPPLCMTALV